MNKRNIALVFSMFRLRCPICGEEFRTKFNMREHLRKHWDYELDELVAKATTSEAVEMEAVKPQS